MPVTCVIGLQWGDEAKGKLVDLLTEQNDVVVRYQGGANAGHTVVREGQTFKLSLVPSGIFRPEVQCVIATGVVLNPVSLLAEIDGLRERGVAVGKNLMISDRAHVIFPWHFEEDRLLDQQCAGRGHRHHAYAASGRAIATRSAARWRCGWAICTGPSSDQRIEQITRVKNELLGSFGKKDAGVKLDAQEVFNQYHAYAQRLAPHVADTTAYLLDAAEAGQTHALRGRPGLAAGRRPRHIPLCHQQQQFGRRRLGGLGRAGTIHHKNDRSRQGLQHARRRRTVSHRTRQRDRRAHPPLRQRVRHGDAAAAPLRLVRCGGRPLYRAA